MRQRWHKSWEILVTVCVALYYVIYVAISKDTLTLSDNLKSRLKVIPTQYLTAQVEIGPTFIDEWKLGYVQYATDIAYLQLAVANFAQIKAAKPLGDLIVLYNNNLELQPQFDTIHSLALENDIILEPISLLSNKKDKSIWKDSFTKLHIFEMDQYDRLIYFDADSLLLNVSQTSNNMFHNGLQNLNELFYIPSNIDIAAPQAYWLSTQHINANIKIPVDGVSNTQNSKLRSLLDDRHKFDNREKFFATHIMVVKPKKQIYNNILQYVNNPWYYRFIHPNKCSKSNDYDMEIINKFIDDDLHKGNLNFGIIDHKTYGVLTGEFREDDHSRFMADPQFLPFIDPRIDTQAWDPLKVIYNTKLIHFSDEPIPKPWLQENNFDHYNTFKIYCSQNFNNSKFEQEYPVNKPRLTHDCNSVNIWNWIREEFKTSRTIL